MKKLFSAYKCCIEFCVCLRGRQDSAFASYLFPQAALALSRLHVAVKHPLNGDRTTDFAEDKEFQEDLVLVYEFLDELCSRGGNERLAPMRGAQGRRTSKV